MSDPFDPKDNSDNSPETEPAKPASTDEVPSEGLERSLLSAPPEAIPLPNFKPDDEEKVSSETPMKLSPARPPRLDDLLTPEKSTEDSGSEKEAPKRIYQISPAEPDWAGYGPLSPEDETSSPQEDTGSGWKTAWAVLREVGETIILTLIIFLLIQTVIRNFRVVGTSMVDNLHDGQYLIIDKLSYNPLVMNVLDMGGPQRGDVIVFEPPNRPAEDYVKRIVALPGETIEINRGVVFINGRPLDEPFQPHTGTYSMPPRVVPEGQVFVLGDNRNNSNDSHNWGPLPIENVVGRAWLSYWPPDRWGTIPRSAPTAETTLKYFLNELVPSANAESE